PLEPPGCVLPVIGGGIIGIDGGEGCTAPLPAPGGVLPPLVVNCKDANKKGTRLKAKMRLLGFNMMVSTNLFI
ncbi:MAG: hypothetical protein O1I87_11560, partial [Cylindrospermopsis raciborskii PAMP2012]|uniref:hypothetical protein n=1 Tax=Cylindrospermopsis raciborskii TaxID=77022 RepID=UPI0022C47A94